MPQEETKVKVVKKKLPKIIPVTPPKVEYQFTCPRCGSHLGTEHVVSVGKMTAPGIGYTKVVMCRICGASQSFKF